MMDLLQWNVNGFWTWLPDLQALIQCHNPAIICLYNHPDDERTSEGMTIIVKDCIYCILVPLHSLLQLSAVHMHLPNLYFAVCNIYLSPAILLCPDNLTSLISQLPPPFILLDDFNAKNILWGAVLSDKRGRSVYDVCAGFDLILLNTGAHMHLCLESGTSSALDHAFCSPGLAVHLDWSVLPDLHDSDHYPINLHISTPSAVI
jgi:hypothetical protein